MNRLNFKELQWTDENHNLFKEHLLSLAQEEYKKFSASLIPNCNNMIGVRIPALREIAKQISKGDWRSFLTVASDEYFEMVMIQGFVLGYIDVDCQTRLEYIENFVPKIDNWSVCDSTCSSFKFAQKNRVEVFDFLKTYLNSKEEYELRFAIVMLLNHFIVDEYIDSVLKILGNLNHSGYYVKMAVAWTLSICFIKYNDKTMSLICSDILDDETLKMTLQKIVESNRVDKSTKDEIRKLKKQKLSRE